MSGSEERERDSFEPHDCCAVLETVALAAIDLYLNLPLALFFFNEEKALELVFAEFPEEWSVPDSGHLHPLELTLQEELVDNSVLIGGGAG